MSKFIILLFIWGVLLVGVMTMIPHLFRSAGGSEIRDWILITLSVWRCLPVVIIEVSVSSSLNLAKIYFHRV